jgi:hypothetical protein
MEQNEDRTYTSARTHVETTERLKQESEGTITMTRRRNKIKLLATTLTAHHPRPGTLRPQLSAICSLPRNIKPETIYINKCSFLTLANRSLASSFFRANRANRAIGPSLKSSTRPLVLPCPHVIVPSCPRAVVQSCFRLSRSVALSPTRSPVPS